MSTSTNIRHLKSCKKESCAVCETLLDVYSACETCQKVAAKSHLYYWPELGFYFCDECDKLWRESREYRQTLEQEAEEMMAI